MNSENTSNTNDPILEIRQNPKPPIQNIILNGHDNYFIPNIHVSIPSIINRNFLLIFLFFQTL